MMNFNEVTIIGRLTRDTELKKSAKGTSIGTTGVASNRSYKQGEEWLEETTFIDVTAFGKTAETLATGGKKGVNVFLSGWLKYECWEDKRTGEKRSKLVLIGEKIIFLDKKTEEPF